MWPGHGSVIEVMAQYNRGVRAAKALAGFIRGHGYDAEGHGGPIAGPFTMVPAALAAGLGELGKHGSIINRQFGSSFRLAAVTPALPLVAAAPDTFGTSISTPALPTSTRPTAAASASPCARGALRAERPGWRPG